MPAKSKTIYLSVGDIQLPLKIYRERRRGARASLGREALLLRLPAGFSSRQEAESIEWARKWIEKQAGENEQLLQRFRKRQYRDGDLLEVGDRQYRLRIEASERTTHAAQLENGVITLRLSAQSPLPERQKSIRTLLSRVIAQDFLPSISRRVHTLNERYFGEPIGRIRLKYNHSNWGSCSGKSNINLSTRLLFAPPEVIDYVIIHELAHLIEMSHSPKFWRIIGEIDPHYREKEKWLKANGSQCDF